MRRKGRKVSTYHIFTIIIIEFNEIVKIYDQRFEEKKSNATKLIEASKKVGKKEQAEHLKQEAARCIDAAKNEAQQKILLNEKRKNPW